MTHPTDDRAWELAKKIDAEYDSSEPEPEILMTPGMLSLLVRALLAEQARTEPHKAEDAPGDAARDVLAERQRQISKEGWTTEHDDDHHQGDMARAAASYAAQAGICGSWPAGAYMASLPPLDDEERGEMMWPWNREWWKPKNPRADLVRAGALILAEIERLDRAAIAQERKA